MANKQERDYSASSQKQVIAKSEFAFLQLVNNYVGYSLIEH